MLQQAGQSLIVGAVIAVVCFIPYLIYQYRRYGQFSASRMVWMGAMLVYLTALIGYTLFPLPGAAWCTAGHHDLLVLDPTVYFRDLWEAHQGGQSWSAVLTSWTCLQMVLNVLLFLPLGVIVRHLWKIGVARMTLIGLGVSLLIELTQYTGDWFIAPCPYRVADVNDLLTNTLGAFLGALLALLMPRLAADADALEATRAVAKPITRGRRYAGMLFDLAAQVVLLLTVDVAAAVVYLLFVGSSEDHERASIFGQTVTTVADIGCFALVIGFALIGSGASIGQRLVYLKPLPTRPHPRLWLLLRALMTQGVALAVWLWAPAGDWLALVWLMLAVIWVLFRTCGLSFTLAGCDLVDARPAPPVEAPPLVTPDETPAAPEATPAVSQ